MIKAKTFIEALNCFSTDPRRARRFLDDKRLAQNEKVILKCFFLLRENQHQEILTELSSITEIADPVVVAQKNLLLGITYNNLDQHHKAIACINESISQLKKYKLSYFEMIGDLNLFIIYQNLKDEKAMRGVLAHLKKLKITDPLSQIRILRCHFKYYVFMNKIEAAESTLDEISSLKKFMSDSDAIGLLVDQFEFSITKNDFTEARGILTKMKNHRAFASTEHYNFLKKLLDHQMDDKPLYVTNQDFVNSPILFHQIKVVQFLAEADTGEAQIAWKMLRNMNSNLYQDNFNYTGPICLFSICMEKHLDKINTPEIISDPISFLQNHEGPVRKEVLFKAFWGREPESKEDFAKLSKHLYDLKEKYGLNLKTQKGCYLLIKDDKKKAA